MNGSVAEFSGCPFDCVHVAKLAGGVADRLVVARGLRRREPHLRGVAPAVAGFGEGDHDPKPGLAVVLLEIFARAGVEAAGVSFPGHFLVRSPGPTGPLFVDPFDGRILSREDLRELHGRVAGEPSDPDPRLLEPADKKQVLVRMLHNLRGIFAARGDRPRLRAVLERLEILTPSDELRREIVSLGGESPVPAGKSRILN